MDLACRVVVVPAGIEVEATIAMAAGTLPVRSRQPAATADHLEVTLRQGMDAAFGIRDRLHDERTMPARTPTAQRVAQLLRRHDALLDSSQDDCAGTPLEPGPAGRVEQAALAPGSAGLPQGMNITGAEPGRPVDVHSLVRRPVGTVRQYHSWDLSQEAFESIELQSREPPEGRSRRAGQERGPRPLSGRERSVVHDDDAPRRSLPSPSGELRAHVAAPEQCRRLSAGEYSLLGEANVLGWLTNGGRPSGGSSGRHIATLQTPGVAINGHCSIG